MDNGEVTTSGTSYTAIKPTHPQAFHVPQRSSFRYARPVVADAVQNVVLVVGSDAAADGAAAGAAVRSVDAAVVADSRASFRLRRLAAQRQEAAE